MISANYERTLFLQCMAKLSANGNSCTGCLGCLLPPAIFVMLFGPPTVVGPLASIVACHVSP